MGRCRARIYLAAGPLSAWRLTRRFALFALFAQVRELSG